jgi:hypothetical protein
MTAAKFKPLIFFPVRYELNLYIRNVEVDRLCGLMVSTWIQNGNVTCEVRTELKCVMPQGQPLQPLALRTRQLLGSGLVR